MKLQGSKLVVHRPDLEPGPRKEAVTPAIEPQSTPVPGIGYSSGPSVWAALHRRALAATGSDDSRWLDENVTRRLPCGDCHRHWMLFLLKYPPTWATFFAWTVDAHNSVNSRLGKPVLTIAEARAIWSAAT